MFSVRLKYCTCGVEGIVLPSQSLAICTLVSLPETFNLNFPLPQKTQHIKIPHYTSSVTDGVWREVCHMVWWCFSGWSLLQLLCFCLLHTWAPPSCFLCGSPQYPFSFITACWMHAYFGTVLWRSPYTQLGAIMLETVIVVQMLDFSLLIFSTDVLCKTSLS